MNNKKIYTDISEYFQIALGIFLASVGLKAFLLPNDFLDGGVTGTAILVNSQFESINISILLVVINIPFLILAYFTLSKRILIKSIFSILGLALVIHYVNFDVVTDDKLLISIFGGLFVGCGIGLTIKNGAVLDGSEILGVFLNDRFGISIGQIILYFNIILFSITAFILSVEIAMYSILTYIITAKVIDLLIEGFEDFIGVMIVSKHNIKIKSAIINELGAGLTVYKGEKGYGSSGELENFNIIHTVINRIDIRKMHRLINNVDPDAFYIEFDINHIKGGVLRRYLAKNKGKQLPKEILDYNKK
ncbi:MAG: YitT family protein [Flavobacteriaceae bacterium]|nr:YitT family protein [Flavobacteriaceae bacterium]